jgi:nucleotide-binding universal stress UspA family protein
MRQLKRLIVGHDLGAGGEVAAKSAIVLAKRSGAALRLVHVIEPLEAYQRISHPLTSPYTREEIEKKAEERLQGLTASPDFAGLNVEYEVHSGKPFVEIIITARTGLADLIVVGSSSPEDETFLGGTSELIVRKAPVPVLVTKKPLSATAKIFLVPTDFSDCARKAAEEAIMLAKSFSGRVAFLHVIDLDSSYTVAYAHELGISLPMPPAPEELEPEWDNFLAGLPLDQVPWEKCAGEGHAAATIVQQAQQMRADVIVIGTHGRSGLPHMLLGSVAEKVVRTASCAVLTIRPDAFQFELP